MIAADSAHSEPFHDWQSTTQAKTQIGGWITPGMMMADAIKIFESRGFSCGTSQLPPDYTQTVTVCTHSTPPPPPPSQRMVTPPVPVSWFVTLHFGADATVADFIVQRFPKALGE